MSNCSCLIAFYLAGESVEPEALNKKALDIVQRVRDKLTGKDFNTEVSDCGTFQQIRHVDLTLPSCRRVWKCASRWSC